MELELGAVWIVEQKVQDPTLILPHWLPCNAFDKRKEAHDCKDWLMAHFGAEGPYRVRKTAQYRKPKGRKYRILLVEGGARAANGA